MRDPERIKPFYDELAELHKKYFPDWRIGQFWCNFERWIDGDIFFYEEDRLIELIREFVRLNS